MQLLKHISGLERQLGHLRAEREKLTAATKAVSGQQGRDNTCLRSNLAQVTLHYFLNHILNQCDHDIHLLPTLNS